MKNKYISLLTALIISASAFSQEQWHAVFYRDGKKVLTMPASQIDSIVPYISEEPDTFTSHEYVDLGLSVMWAVCNVGASKPEEYGKHYAWGETKPKSEYRWENYKYGMGAYNTLTKYCNNSEYGYNGYTDTLTVLLPEDDAAHANWGRNWRMPTHEEFNELRNYSNCSWEWTTVNDVYGYKVTSLIPGYEGNSIFLPAEGYWVNGEWQEYSSYWSSSVDTGYAYMARGLDFNIWGYGDFLMHRMGDSPVRPVWAP